MAYTYEALRSRTSWLGRNLLMWLELRHVTVIIGMLLGQSCSHYREQARSQHRSWFSLVCTSCMMGSILCSKPKYFPSLKQWPLGIWARRYSVNICYCHHCLFTICDQICRQKVLPLLPSSAPLTPIPNRGRAAVSLLIWIVSGVYLGVQNKYLQPSC